MQFSNTPYIQNSHASTFVFFFNMTLVFGIFSGSLHILGLFVLALWRKLVLFDRDCIECVDCFGSIDILAMFVLLIREHGMFSISLGFFNFSQTIYSLLLTSPLGESLS